jgi:hypothetical protein
MSMFVHKVLGRSGCGGFIGPKVGVFTTLGLLSVVKLNVVLFAIRHNVIVLSAVRNDISVLSVVGLHFLRLDIIESGHTRVFGAVGFGGG